MPPKKQDKPIEPPKQTFSEKLQTDHELFLQAFEKPTQIYRYLRTRHHISPIFLNRALSYMRHRMSRTHKNRKTFKVDSILARVEARLKKASETRGPLGNLTLTFTGIHDYSSKVGGDLVTVEAILLKICHKKRKDVSCPIIQLSGRCEVPRNPDPNNPPHKSTAISVPSDNFNLSNGHLVKSYVLLLRVIAHGNKSKQNGYCNGDISDSEDPPHKRRKNHKGSPEDLWQFGAELVVYDKIQQCLLTDGEYQLVLQEFGQKASPRKPSSWETFIDSKDKVIGQFDVFNNSPLVSFYLAWNDSFINGSDEIPSLDHMFLSSYHEERPSKMNLRSGGGVRAVEKPKKKPQRVFYQFLYNNNTRQQTEARDDLHCPWCSLNCVELYSLLKHLKLCHSRFIFTYTPHPKGAGIDVSINDCYDGSYVGNPHDLYSQTGMAFNSSGPTQRTPVTHVMVSKPKRLPPPSLSEFLEPDETDIDGPRPYISGHNRLYYHTGTCLAVRPQEIDIDSEGENDPQWLRTKTQLMIDEFTDVNEGEKDLMKMWNLHVMKHGFVGDCQISLACSMFVELHGHEVLRRNLYSNFLLHLANLFDFGLISASVVYRTITQLQRQADKGDFKPHPKCSPS
ncbi:polycomb protein Su(z)12 isoform X2 [Tachypleus tridentatus]|uniref:polycomb protein Su(z)12 isoform X2 n=1 Tax=Tachypleus tridentatus TaxID=6853 RepID=UPI003FD24333